MCITFTTVTFKIPYVTCFGWSIYIIGNIPELGNWEISKALKLRWQEVIFIFDSPTRATIGALPKPSSSIILKNRLNTSI